MNITKNTLSIVTGATGGLGREISKSILQQHGKLVFVARDIDKSNLFEQEIDEINIDSFYKINVELHLKEDLYLLEKFLVELLANTKDIEEIFLFNNASTIEPIALIEDVSFDEISKALTINIVSAFTLTSMLIRLKYLTGIRKINIINISSGVSIIPVKGWSAYCISKAGLNMLSKCIASEYSDPAVFSLSINPGPINTNMQEKIRNADIDKIPATKKFETMYVEGKLQQPADVSKKIFRVLASNDYLNGDFIDFNKMN